MQYVQVKFQPNASRAFTYTHDGERLGVGDKVNVMSNRGNEVTVDVVGVLDEKPAELADIELKPIVRVRSRNTQDEAAHGASAKSPPAGSPDTVPSGGEAVSTREKEQTP